jgi:TRAP-type C4-dicarboxylate transport system permease small subunit
VQPSEGGTAGRRIAALIAALIFAFAGAVMIVASLDLADGPLCEDVAAGTALPEDGECFDISSSMQTVKTVLTFASGIAAAVVFLAGLFCLFTGRGIRVVMIAAGTAIVLGALGILI